MSISEADVYRFGPAAKKQIMEKMAAAGKGAAKPSKMHNVKAEYGGIYKENREAPLPSWATTEDALKELAIRKWNNGKERCNG